MINTDRIVPVMATDLLTLYSRIFTIAGTTVTTLTATVGATGEFEITENPANAVLCDEPLTTLDFASGVTAATVYFAPAYDYSGFTVGGTAVTTAGAEVETDPGAFYSAVLANGTVTITQIGL